ncbi:hypothetical protein PENSTE_c014G08496 [Penicillium steckii]|uniref:Uncharacterized protein n=1 Tax=Penicillium steckii TaxID=303698 RepID=A0A1V6T0S5_9EURO|nr:hypothetical protein PENSTE_c014G08496 [Penicillium steckii]
MISVGKSLRPALHDLNMILRDLSAFNMGRGAYDTTGVKKPGAPPPPPK